MTARTVRYVFSNDALARETEAARALLANIRDVIADDEEAIHDTIEGETSLFEAIGAAVDRLSEIDTLADAIKAKAAALKARKDRLENQADKIRLAILDAMTIAELKKLELPQATLSRKSTPPKAIVVSEADIPSRFFVDQAPQLDKKTLLEALKAGEQIDGAQLSNGGETLQVRI